MNIAAPPLAASRSSLPSRSPSAAISPTPLILLAPRLAALRHRASSLLLSLLLLLLLSLLLLLLLRSHHCF